MMKQSSATTAGMIEVCDDLKKQLKAQEESDESALQESRLQLTSFKRSKACLIGVLNPRLDSCSPSKLMESFAASILSKCAKANNDTVSLRQVREKLVRYKKVEKTRA